MPAKRTAATTAWAVAAVALASQALLAWVALRYRDDLPAEVADTVPLVLASAPIIPLLAALGAVILRRHPSHAVGWLMCAAAAAGALDALARAHALWGAYIAPRGLPGTAWTAWFADWSWLPSLMLIVVFVPLLYPDGHLPSRRWRPVAIALVAWLTLATLGYAGVDEPLIDFPGIAKPLQVSGAIVPAHLMLLTPAAVAIAAASVLVRRRHAVGDEREQLRWLIWASSLAVVGWAGIFALPAARQWGIYAAVLTLVPSLLIPVAITMAIVKYRLYGIDTLVNRTLVYGGLTVAVLGTYAAVVATASAATGAAVEWRWSVLVVVGVAILAYPLREWLQRRVNRFMYGDRDDPARAMASLSLRIGDTLSPSTVLPAVVETVAHAMRLPYVAIELDDATPGPVAAYGTPRGTRMRMPLAHHGEAVGTLEVSRRSTSEDLSDADHRLLDGVARQIAAAAHGVRLAEELQRSRERLVTTREEERLRLRRDLHDGLGSALAGLALHAGNARAALPQSPEQAARWLASLEAGIGDAVTDLRRIVDDLRPPALDELGLEGAVRERAQAVLPGTAVHSSLGSRTFVAAVEVAAYRIVAEALANVATHAPGSRATVELAVRGTPPALALAVVDDGPGFDARAHAGVGLQSMRDRAAEVGGRCTIAARPGEGVSVAATLPLAASPAREPSHA